MEVDGTRTADECELDLKRTEFTALVEDLVDREREHATLQQQLAAFESEYLRIVGTSYAALDDTYARMAEVLAARRPDDGALQEAARRARGRADATAAQAENRTSLEQRPSFEPSTPLDTLYRAIARELHPDLAPADDERALRRPWMARLNAAYRRQDVDALKNLRTAWEHRQEPARGNDTPDHLARAWLFGKLTTDDYADRTRIADALTRVSRQIAHAKQRLDEIRSMLDRMRTGQVHNLYQLHRIRLDAGRNLLDEMAAKLDVQIAYAKWEGWPPQGARALTMRDDGTLPARGLADLARWQLPEAGDEARRAPNTTAEPARSAGNVQFEFSSEQWSKLRPLLDRLFVAVRRELKPDQDLLREFIKGVKISLIETAKLPQEVVKAAVKRWNRETRGGRDVEAPSPPPNRDGGKSPAGQVPPGGTGAGRKVAAGGTRSVSAAGRGGNADAGSEKCSESATSNGTGDQGSESANDTDGSGPARQARALSGPKRPVVDIPPNGDTSSGNAEADCVNRGRQCEREGNSESAAAWYRQAADQGHAEAQFRLGLLYRDGRGVPQVRIVAAMWLRRASDQGHAEAASQLGDMRGV